MKIRVYGIIKLVYCILILQQPWELHHISQPEKATRGTHISSRGTMTNGNFPTGLIPIKLWY